MGEQFERVAIVIDQGGVEYIVLEPQLVIDFGQGQGPKGGVIDIKDGWIAAHGAGEAVLAAGYDSPGRGTSSRNSSSGTLRASAPYRLQPMTIPPNGPNRTSIFMARREAAHA